MKRSLKSISALISLGTLLSKAGGMVRQIVIAGVFGISSAYDAYNYAYILPGFFLVLIGGINGPLHNAIVSVLSRKSPKEGRYILSSINTSISFVLIICTIVLVLGADQIISIVGPGLDIKTHAIAVEQLKIMSPITLLAGLIGIGFGALNARDKFLIPSISPIISSLVLIIAVSAFGQYQNKDIQSIDFALKGGIVLAIASLIGAIIQWIIQIPFLRREGLLQFKLVFDWKSSGVKEVWKIIVPATLSSGMLQINVITDLFFASSIVGAASGLSYANFLIQAPLGLISNALLLPLLPTFSKLKDKEEQIDLIKRVRQGFIFSSASMICLGAIFIALSVSITKIIFGRGVFDGNAINLVSGLLICYGIGMPAYLIRDLLVRIFYSLGDGHTPFKISVIGIGLNIFLDWFFIGAPLPWTNELTINFGAKGLILATVGVNIFTCLVLLLKLKLKIKNLLLKKLAIDFLKLLFCGLISGLIASNINLISLNESNQVVEIFKFCSALLISTLSFCIFSNLLGIKEVKEIVKILRLKIKLN
ncbi:MULTISPECIES: murein biosynthesis integral membrane protein MurJ [unclassified Prochlorococcus]|uniref:murein biosynthesis integral membrane protein MurJ n=1 Tax=unclassified Prochlorococcus TaxID=2627481 RepID=UPI000533A649|nr:MULTISPECIES: murein biosynthesis integral membrane protein MurJ [unclassified Prochlorococcus]KGG16668.1 putative peptidoglycan lipid II flippase MurJ [Prochlorococcus sp. MIT 0602]KGG18360.1 putative peptidoglycan lipid II flippase MurJ [Prochlorococcus sp. MIT 0603]